MLVTLMPMFDEKMKVAAYSLFSQRKNHFLSPNLLGTGQNDGVGQIPGLESLEDMGIENLPGDTKVFVAVNNISLFAGIEEQTTASPFRIVITMDNSVVPEEKYVLRMLELKSKGYKLAIRKLPVSKFEEYRPVLSVVDYVFLDHKRIDINKAKVYFSRIYPNVSLVASGVSNMDEYAKLREDGGYAYFEGEFYQVPVEDMSHEVNPLKINYIRLLNIVNDEDFDLTKAADIIGRDTAMVISLLKMVNRIAVNSEITSIRHAAAMLGQKELKRWITTAAAGALYADKPNEITRISLIRGKFTENLASQFGLASQAQELFLLGLFSVLDVILEKPMAEALEIVKVSKDIREALVNGQGKFAEIKEFTRQYENGNWQEVSRLMILQDIDMEAVNGAYIDAVQWYREVMEE